MSDKIKKGSAAEQRAAEYLAEKGFDIVERNYRYGKSEIDLIVRKPNWLIFVEVKMRSSIAFGYPEEFVDWRKRKNILNGAEQYIYDTDWQGNVRYDIVAISIINGEEEIKHIEDVFF